MTIAETAARPSAAGSWRFSAIGTSWTVTTLQPVGAVRPRVIEVIEAFDQAYSRFRADSLVRRLGAVGGEVRFPAGASELFDLVDQLHELSDGAVDPTVAAALEHLGYDADYRLTPLDGPPPRTAHWGDLLRDRDLLTAAAPVLLDVGAIGKGRLVDLVARTLRAEGVEDFVIDAGGDVRAAGSLRPRIGLEDPRDAGRIVGVLPLEDASLCASGVNRRAWGDGLHHILDARTGAPTRRVAATWVRASTAMLADGLATALFFTEPQRLRERFAFDFALIRSDGRAEASGPFITALQQRTRRS